MQYCITFFPHLFSWFSKLSFINKILGQFTFNYLFLTLPFTTVLSIQKVYEVTPSDTSEPLQVTHRNLYLFPLGFQTHFAFTFSTYCSSSFIFLGGHI